MSDAPIELQPEPMQPPAPTRIPLPEMPDGFPTGILTTSTGVTIKKIKALELAWDMPDTYLKHYRHAKTLYPGSDGRMAASNWARRAALYDLFNANPERFKANICPTEPHEMLAIVKASGRTCDYDTLVDWVAQHIQTPWENIDIGSIPDPVAVNWLVEAKNTEKGGGEKFFAKYAARKQKLADAAIEETEAPLRRADKRKTEELISDLERAYE